ncbi:MAG: ribonuclease G [Thiogranum sp.]|nr:ribonuclease G [Thiogranum sp.]
MTVELLVNVTPQEIRVAVVENGVLQEVFIERTRRRGLVGNIYNGVVCRVLPGMQAAFVEIGLDRAAFLHASDIAVSVDDEKIDPAPVAANGDNINRLLQTGQTLLVQVIKDPLGSKGARLTTHITIPSRYLVFMPEAHNIGVSQRIEDESERQRLRDLVVQARGDNTSGGIIVRTAAEGISDEAVASDLRFLQRLWASVQERIAGAGPAEMVHEDLPLVLRVLRDISDAEVEKLRIDSREAFQRVEKFITQFIPELSDKLEYYPGERPIFDLYGIDDEIQKALGRKVQLKSGGYLIIDQTEAMTTIDVNTGAYVGHRNLEETIFKTNLEAAQAIVRQLRLRNLGGIIIVDFIDMQTEDHKRQVLRALEKHVERDHSHCYISEISDLGLVQMTRKRTRESLEHVLCETCPTCGGRATVKSAETICYEIFREILREARQFDSQQLLVLASQEVVDLFLDEESTSLAELEAFIGKPIKFQVESLYTQEQFDVVLL